MSLRLLLWVVSGVLMGVAAFTNTPRVSLATLAWSLFILGWAFGSVEVN